MARAYFKPLTKLKDSKKHWSKAELAERKRYRARVRSLRRDRRMTPEERAERTKRDDAKLFNWEAVLKHVVKREDGCWEWHGAFRVSEGRVRPRMRAGTHGDQPADFVVCCLAHGRPAQRTYVAAVCPNGTIGCVAPAHLTWTVRVVETAKRRKKDPDEQEVMAGRQG